MVMEKQFLLPKASEENDELPPFHVQFRKPLRSVLSIGCFVTALSWISPSVTRQAGVEPLFALSRPVTAHTLATGKHVQSAQTKRARTYAMPQSKRASLVAMQAFDENQDGYHFDPLDLDLDAGDFDPQDTLMSKAENDVIVIPIAKTANPFDFSDLNLSRSALTLAWMFAPLTLFVEQAHAAAGEYGIFEGKAMSLVHPFVMFGLFAFSLWTGYLGFQWRQQRTIGDELKELNKLLPTLSNGKKAVYPLATLTSDLKTQLENIEDAAEKAKLNDDISKLSTSSMLANDEKYADLSATRKSLSSKNLRDNHFNSGSGLLAMGTVFAIAAPLNTFFRTGKLFPGPHLYAGAGMVAIWAVAAALVPPMQKGNEAARAGHIGLNVLNIVLFAWQTGTGIKILLKVLGNANLPMF